MKIKQNGNIMQVDLCNEDVKDMSTVLYSNALIIPIGADVKNLGNAEINIKALPKETAKEKIMPRPVVRDGNGKLVKEEYDFRDWYLKLQEEFFEMAESSAFFQAGIEVQGLNQSYERLAEELADIITVCISYLDYLDYDEKSRSKLFAAVNKKNEKRGYFKESD